MGRVAGGRHAAATAALLGLLGLAGPLPAAGQPAPTPASPAATSDRGAYLQRTQDEMAVWRMKMGGMADKAEATGQAAATTAEADLHVAWDKAQAGARNLQTATAAGWSDAKSSFEQASRDLQHAWDKSRL
jgi:hypothetical protein